jgi:hypothetical protein
MHNLLPIFPPTALPLWKPLREYTHTHTSFFNSLYPATLPEPSDGLAEVSATFPEPSDGLAEVSATLPEPSDGLAEVSATLPEPSDGFATVPAPANLRLNEIIKHLNP